jgi:hypothetical protein
VFICFVLCCVGEACPSGLPHRTDCAAGYNSSFGCLACERGWYRMAGRCWKCDLPGHYSIEFGIALAINFLVLLLLWWYIEIVVKMSSLTVIVSLINSLVLISSIRVVWHPWFLKIFFSGYFIGVATFWPDFINIAANECIDGPLELRDDEPNLIWPLWMPFIQYGVLISFSLIAKYGRRWARGLLATAKKTHWSPRDRAFNSILIVATLEAPYIWYWIFIRFAWATRFDDNSENRQVLRPALTFHWPTWHEYLLMLPGVICLLPSVLSIWSVIPSHAAEHTKRDERSHLFVALFKRFSKNSNWTRRWEFILGVCSGGLGFATSAIYVDSAASQSFATLCFLSALGVYLVSCHPSLLVDPYELCYA